MAPVTLLTTRFNCFCTTTGQAIPPGSRVAYDSELSQFHTLMKLDNNIEENYYQASSEVFKYIEKAFIHWYKEQSVYNPEGRCCIYLEPIKRDWGKPRAANRFKSLQFKATSLS